MVRVCFLFKLFMCLLNLFTFCTVFCAPFLLCTEVSCHFDTKCEVEIEHSYS